MVTALICLNVIDGKRKVCRKCGRRFPATFFYDAQTACKACAAKRRRKYYLANRERLLERSKRDYRENRDHYLAYHKKLREHPERQRDLREAKRRHYPKRYARRKADPIMRLSDWLQGKTRQVFRSRARVFRRSDTFDGKLGYSKGELRTHLMDMIDTPCPRCCEPLRIDNVEIDHIKPRRTAKTESDVWLLFALQNLRLMCPTCNKRRNGEYDG